MNTDWGSHFQASYTPQDVADAAQAVLSRQAETDGNIGRILLMDLVSEIACKMKMDVDDPKGVKVLITSPDKNFKDQRLAKTSQFVAFKQARKLDMITDDMLHDLAEQSASASVIAQVHENGDDPTGMIIQTVPLGFEGHIKASLQKPSILSRLFGGRR